jgi:hypothetical protein
MTDPGSPFRACRRRTARVGHRSHAAAGRVPRQLPQRRGRHRPPGRGSRAGGQAAWPRTRGRRSGNGRASRAPSSSVAHDAKGRTPQHDQAAQPAPARPDAAAAARGILIAVHGFELIRQRLMPLLPVDQHFVAKGRVADGDAEQGAERGVPGAAAVEAEDELVEIGFKRRSKSSLSDSPVGSAMAASPNLR